MQVREQHGSAYHGNEAAEVQDGDIGHLAQEVALRPEEGNLVDVRRALMMLQARNTGGRGHDARIDQVSCLLDVLHDQRHIDMPAELGQSSRTSTAAPASAANSARESDALPLASRQFGASFVLAGENGVPAVG